VNCVTDSANAHPYLLLGVFRTQEKVAMGVDVKVRPLETFTNPQARQIFWRLGGIR